MASILCTILLYDMYVRFSCVHYKVRVYKARVMQGEYVKVGFMQMLRECVLLIACLTTSLDVKLYTRMGNALIIILLGICVYTGVLQCIIRVGCRHDGAHIIFYLYTRTTHLLLSVLGEITSYL